MELPRLQALAYPGVVSLVAFLAFSSQYLFNYIEPRPLRKGDAYLFNALVSALLICYTRTCFTDPGRIPRDWPERYALERPSNTEQNAVSERQRYCRKCEAPKPPRAHHCKTCKRCIMKMDHHCVWTANCVSHITFPHFVRFLIYAVLAMFYLEYHLWIRCSVLWQNRNLPSYLGPSVLQLIHLFMLTATNSLVLFALVLLLGKVLWGLTLNISTIEGWEIDRHEALLRRARTMGGFLDSPDGSRMRMEHQEFPWDVGIWTNICQAMGTRNPLMWLLPFASSPSIESGLQFEHNGIEDPSKPWPPPDPDRMFRVPRVQLKGEGFTQPLDVESFRKRQAADMGRYVDGELVMRRLPFHERYKHLANEKDDGAYAENDAAVATDDEDDEELEEKSSYRASKDEGEEAWRNKEGERLADFGLDEEAEFYDEDAEFRDEDNIPLAELIRRRKQ